MKNILLTILLFVMTSLSFAQIGNHIPTDRLPPLEQYSNNPNPYYSVLPSQNAGCLDSLRYNGGLTIDKIIDITN